MLRLFKHRRRVNQRPKLTREERAKLEMIVSLLNEHSQPNINALMPIVRDLKPMSLAIKQNGFAIARELAAALPIPLDTVAQHVGLASKASVQSDLESEWAAHWCAELKIPVTYHRKIWEYVFVLQALHDHDCLQPGRRGLGFGCGTEPVISYFAKRGIDVTVTDLPAEDDRSKAWSVTNQHSASADAAFDGKIVDRATFDRHVRFRPVDMNHIPQDLANFDFCWSICAMEHLGSIQQGLDFVRNALGTLQPGGVAVHTTEHNIDPSGPTIDNWVVNLFQRRHFEVLAETLAEEGHEVAHLDFSLGDGPMDRFVDLPPWPHESSEAINEWLGPQQHLKLAIDGFVATCFGLIVRKNARP